MDNYTATEQAYKNGYEAGKPKWISVEERLPEEEGDYLTCNVAKMFPKHSIHFTYFRAGDRYWDFVWSNEITHWMPLPEPPEN